MSIGTSKGAYYETEMDMHLDVDKGIQANPDIDTNDQNELPGNPGSAKIIEAGKKDQMPYPDNKIPDSDPT